MLFAWRWLQCCCASEDVGARAAGDENIGQDDDTPAARPVIPVEAAGFGHLEPSYKLFEPTLKSSRTVEIPSQAVRQSKLEFEQMVSESGTFGDSGFSNKVFQSWCAIIAGMLYLRHVRPTLDAHRALDQRRWAKAQERPAWRACQSRVKQATDAAFDLVRKLGSDSGPDAPDSEWRPTGLLKLLFGDEYADTLMLFAKNAKLVLQKQPILAEADVPCKIFGDIHGQFRDLLLHLHAFGKPDESSKLSFVFNGDFVDRGAHQLETIGILLALKLRFPTKVWLVRGNHEDKGMNQRYGFKQECSSRLGQGPGVKVFNCMHETFDCLPFACLVANRAVVLHGGIGQGGWDFADLRDVPRPVRPEQMEVPQNQWLYNILWSDPIPEDHNEDLPSPGVYGVHASSRSSKACRFGSDLTGLFCARNGLDFIIRSHSIQPESLGFEVMHRGKLINVFSARDYEDTNNDGAILHVQKLEGDKLIVRPEVLKKIGSKVP